MTIALFRVDERLIHGQVVVGWGRRLDPDRVIVINDGLADSAFEQEIYRAGLPAGIEAIFWSVDEAVVRLPAVADADETALVLTEDLTTMVRLVRGGVRIVEVNVGGIHAAPGRERVLDYVCLGVEERRRIAELEEAGVRVTAQDVPSAPSVPLFEHVR
jgi:PTS system mannose-specific IIB component/fructoselysine and glucoselysine-specific PTS system IIB component